MKKIQISPSILSADFSQLGNEIKRLEEGGADLIHVDVMDGHFVPNLTIGPPVIKELKKNCSIKFDVHLMISPVHKYIEAYSDAGADIITIHPEATDDLSASISKIKSLNFNNKKWVEFDQNRHVMDPYKNLPDLEYIMPEGLSNIENMSLDSNIKDGGAAMTAWAYMQFEGVSNTEKIQICNALKRYCELDTMAMVIIIEAWKDMINTNSYE